MSSEKELQQRFKREAQAEIRTKAEANYEVGAQKRKETIGKAVNAVIGAPKNAYIEAAIAIDGAKNTVKGAKVRAGNKIDDIGSGIARKARTTALKAKFYKTFIKEEFNKHKKTLIASAAAVGGIGAGSVLYAMGKGAFTPANPVQVAGINPDLVVGGLITSAALVVGSIVVKNREKIKRKFIQAKDNTIKGLKTAYAKAQALKNRAVTAVKRSARGALSSIKAAGLNTLAEAGQLPAKAINKLAKPANELADKAAALKNNGR